MVESGSFATMSKLEEYMLFEHAGGDSKTTVRMRLYGMLFSFWHEPNERIYRRHVLFLCFLAAMCGAAFFIGAVPTRGCGHDIFVFLDNGWRVLNGQSPHVDYTSPWGPVLFLIAGLGLKLSGLSVDGIGYGSAMFGFIIGLWSYALCRNRLKTSSRILMSLYLAGLVLSPYPLGSSFYFSSHAMIYNRYGYGLLGLIMVEAFQSIGDQEKSSEWGGGISTGIVMALTLFMKANYFVAAVILIGASCFVGKFNRQRLFGVTIGFSLVTFTILAYLRFDVAAVVRDLKMAAGARAMGVYLFQLFELFLINSTFIVISALLIIQITKVEKTFFGQKDHKLLIVAVAVSAADLLLLFSNNQRMMMPLSIVFYLLLLNRIVGLDKKLSDTRAMFSRTSYRFTLFIGGLIFLVCLTSDVLGLTYGAFQKAWPSNVQSVVPFREPRLAALLLYDSQYEPMSNGRHYVKYVNDGISFLRKNTQQHETILTMDMANPFPYALGRKPAIGGIASAFYNCTLSDRHHPSEDRYLGNADVVMVPKHPATPGFFYDGFYRIYESALHSRFRLAAESDMWYLYRRK